MAAGTAVNQSTERLSEAPHALAGRTMSGAEMIIQVLADEGVVSEIAPGRVDRLHRREAGGFMLLSDFV